MSNLVFSRPFLVTDISVQKLTFMSLFEVNLGLRFLLLKFNHFLSTNGRSKREFGPFLLVSFVSASVLEGRDYGVLLLLLIILVLVFLRNVISQ